MSAGVTDRHVARVIKRCEDLPGQNLFQSVDDDGTRRNVTSDDVNQYLRDVTDEDFTAKDFRTWAATQLAACALRDLAGFESETDAKRRVVEAIDVVARKLGHTRAVCRRSYIHPGVIDAYMGGRLRKSDRAAVVALLQRAA